MYPAIFLDRDGVIIENRADYVRDWSQVSIFPNAIKALSNPIIKKYKVVIVTNQSAVGRNLISLKTAREINDKLADIIKQDSGNVDAIYMCPHNPEDQCHCRKPQPGMLLQAARELSLNLSASWMIGDAWSDLLAGQAAGTRGTIIVKTGRGARQLLLPRPEHLKEHFVFEDVYEAVHAILDLDKHSHHSNTD
jgi:D-glycero-D-manno-heptose 1,7-bisphosphate phosphatase